MKRLHRKMKEQCSDPPQHLGCLCLHNTRSIIWQHFVMGWLQLLATCSRMLLPAQLVVWPLLLSYVMWLVSTSVHPLLCREPREHVAIVYFSNSRLQDWTLWFLIHDYSHSWFNYFLWKRWLAFFKE